MQFTIPADGILPPGTKLRGTYVIENMIGEGGMGVVYTCYHETLRKRYALKVLEPKYARIQTTRTRFLHEGSIQANLAHPHIVRVIDVIDSEKEGGSAGILAIVMEYVKGDSLDQIIKQRGQLSEYDAVSTTLATLDAIGYAHHMKIIHRDLKPSNIMICNDLAKEQLYNGVKVMDFGIAKVLEEGQQQLTVTGCQMGTPLYMPPEQIENARTIDERADIYALGITLYEMLCGRTPFAEYREFELMRAQMSMKPPSMKNYRRDIPDRLEAIVMKALEKKRENRYPNAETFQRDLLSLGGYDDIPLLLNPYEGTTLQATNTRLQRKIERAIADAEDTSAQKTQKAVKAKDLADAVKNAVVQKSDDRNKQKSPKDEPPTRQHAPQSQNFVFEETLINTPAPAKQKNTPPSEGKNTSRRTQAASPQTEETPKKSKRQTKTTNENEKAPKKSTRASRVNPKNDKTENKHQAIETDKAQRTSAQNTKTTKSTQTTKRSKTPKNRQIVNQPSKTKTVSNLPAPNNNLKNRLKLPLSIAALILLILAVTGLVYRQNNDMKATTTVEPQIAQLQPKKETQLVEDISKHPLEELETPFGRMTLIPAARHMVSTEKQDELRPIELPEFYIDQVEVSHYQYAKCIEAKKCSPLAYAPESMNLPVTNIGIGNAEAFCKFAGKSLPSAEQWEAAARFGGHTNGITFVNVSCDTVLYGANGDCKKLASPKPQNVFSHANGANPGHLRNMLGNVREWVTTPDASQKKVQTKGGSYLSSKSDISIGASVLQPLNQGASDLGFRCVK